MTRTTAIILALATVTALAAPTTANSEIATDPPAYGMVIVDPVPPCRVPGLRYSTLKEAKTKGIAGSGCVLGRVTKRYPKRRHGRGRLKRCRRGTKLLVSRQTPSPSKTPVLPTGSKVNITLTCGKLPPVLRQPPG